MKTAFVLIFLFFAIPLASAQTVSIGDYSTAIDSEVTVLINISDAESVAGGVVNVSFNPSIISVEHVGAGDFGDPVANINNISGWVKLVAARADNVNKNEAVLANIVFNGSSNGTSALTIEYASLNNKTGALITPLTSNGKIVVSLSLDDTSPPSSIRDLVSDSGSSWINWTWTNPSDSDFNHTMVYLDGKFVDNTSDQYFNATNLIQGTIHTISTNTVDIYGNINETWVNDTAKTTGVLSGDLHVTLNKPVNYSIYSVGEQVSFDVNVTDSDNNPISSGISAYVELSGPNNISKHIILSEESSHFVGRYTVDKNDLRGLWFGNITVHNSTSSGLTSFKVYFTGAYFIQPYSNSRSYLLGESANFTAKVMKPGNPAQYLSDENVSLNLSIYPYNSSTPVLESVEMVYDNNSHLFSTDVSTDLIGSGLFTVLFIGNDTSGNIEVTSLLIGVSEDYAIEVSTEKTDYDRDNLVNISGIVKYLNNSPLSNINVNLLLDLHSFKRSYVVNTNEIGEFNYTFHPFDTEAGNYTIRATAANMGLLRNAENNFTIHGLYIVPQSAIVELVENSSRTISFTLYNLGDTTLTSISTSVNDLNISDNVIATIDPLSVPSELQPYESASFNLQIEANTPVPDKAVFQIEVTTDQMSNEISELDVKLFSPTPILKVYPEDVLVGLNKNQTAIRTVGIYNMGYGILRNVTLHQPENSWMRITSNTSIGNLLPGENATFEIHINSYNVDLGVYFDSVNITSDNFNEVQVNITAFVTDLQKGRLLFHVTDALERNLSNANISLINQDTYEEFDGATNSTGYALMNNLPVGRYIFVVSSDGTNTLPQMGNVEVEAMDTPKLMEISLYMSFIDFDWEVTPTSIEDYYNVILKMRFETDVPIPLLLAFPPSIDYNMVQGEEKIGSFKVYNVGLVSIYNVSISPINYNGIILDPLVTNVNEIKGKSSIEVPYKISLSSNAANCQRLSGKIDIQGRYLHFINNREVISYARTSIPVTVKTPVDGSCIPDSPDWPDIRFCVNIDGLHIGDYTEDLEVDPNIIWLKTGPGWKDQNEGKSPVLENVAIAKNNNTLGNIQLSNAMGITLSLGVNEFVSYFTAGTLTPQIPLGVDVVDVIAKQYGINIPFFDGIWKGTFDPNLISPQQSANLNMEKLDTGVGLTLPKILGGGIIFNFGDEECYNCVWVIPIAGYDLTLPTFGLPDIEIYIPHVYLEGGVSIGGGTFFWDSVPDVFIAPSHPHYRGTTYVPWNWPDWDWPDWDWPDWDWPDFNSDQVHRKPRPIVTETIHEVIELSISQNVTMERDAFWAGLGIFNKMPDKNIDNVGVTLHIRDDTGSANDKFFIKSPNLININNVDGSGVISPSGLASAQWLIIPKPGAGGINPEGAKYNISANITYSVDGINFETVTHEIEIIVKPQPEMVLDYFIPSDVIANKPFKLAVKVTNEGYGEARDFAIETAQPVIYYNPSGLLLDFEIIRSQLQGEERSTSMKVDFGDIQPGESKIAWWDMVTSIDGTFTEFTGEFTHSSELGGMETSLIKEINTYIIQKQMGSGELGYDFLANSESDENYYILFNSSTGSSTFVNNANYAIVNMPTPENPVLDVSIEDYTGDWVIVSIEDPYNNAVPIDKVIRTIDGTEIPSYNYWMRNGRILIVDHYDAGFDGNYQIIYSGMPEPGITITSPNGGEDWQNGTTQTIHWSYAGDIGSNVQIELLKSGIVDHEIIASTSIGSSGTGSYSWTIPSTQLPDADYQIKVTSITNSEYTDTSDGYFEISPETPLFTRATVEYINLSGETFNLYSFNYEDNPASSDYMVVVSPLLAQAFVAEDETGNKSEIQKKIDEKAKEIEEALGAVNLAHPGAYIYFVDKDMGYQSNIEKLRADVYGLPFMNYIGPGHLGLIDTFILGKIELLGREKYGPITSYKELTGKEIKPTNEVWKEYSNKVKSKTKSLKPEYILILGYAKEFPEYKIYSPPTHFLQEFFIFSDIQYATYNKNIIQTELISIGRLPIDYSSNYLTSKHSFSKNAIIHSMYNVKQKDIKIAWTWDIVLDNYFKTFINPNLKTLTNQILEIEEPDVNSISQGSILGGNKNYYVDYYIFNENYPNDITVDLNDEHSLFIAGWHGNTRGISAHGGNINFNNMHPLIFTGTSCLISNTADYKNEKLGNPDKLFSYELLSNGASLVGNTMYGVGSTNKVIVTFNENLIQSETLGDAWLKTIKKYNNNLLLETGYARDQFRLLGDPALDTSALDDPLENNVSPLPQYFSISINASYNETQVNDYSLLNINMSSNSSLNINYTLTEDQYSPGSGSPMVPVIYLDIPMPVNQTIDNVTVVFDNSYTQIINLVEYVSYLLTPDGAKVIPGIELHGDYPSVNFTYSLVTVPDERLLKIAAIPVKYNIDNRVAELYRSINITVNPMPYMEENVTAKVHIDPSMDYLALHQSENVSLILSLHNDYSATENATDVSVIAEIPDDLEVIDTDGTQIGHNITWEFDNLTIAGVNSFRSIEMVIQAPISIPSLLTKQINLTATYSNESGGFYEPTESSIQVSLIPPDYMDLKVSNVFIQKPLKLGTQTNVSTVISNEGDIGLKYVPVTLLIDGNESSGGIINLPANESINLNLSINGLEPGSHQVSVIVQPIGLETNLTNNIATEEVDIYFAMLAPLSPTIIYNLSNGSTLPIKFTVTDNDTGEFIYDDSVNISIFNSSDSIIANFNVSSGIQIDLDNKEYAVGFDTKDYSQLTLGEIYTVSVVFGSQLYATTDFIIIEDLTSPFSITYLNSTEGESWINFTWTNPPDPDFNHTDLYLNGTFITNIPAPQNYYNITGLLPDTSYELSTRTVDINGNINETWVNATVRTLPLADTTPPIITFTPPTDPGDTTLTTRNWTFINVSLSEPGFSWLEWNGINESMSGSGTHWYINKTGLDNGVYTYRIWANDSAGNLNVSETRAIEIDYVSDTLPPVIAITSPINDTTYNTDSVDLNYSVNEPIVWQGYSLDGSANITLDGNTTLIGINDGLHTLTVYANDTSGNMNSSTVWFTIDTTPPAGISDLQHTVGQTWINWTWINPADPDFNHTIVYLDGMFRANVSNTSYNATGLDAGTEHTISTHTVDSNGNVNDTWVNDTATTLSAGVHDINISTDYAPETDGIKIKHDGALIDGNNLTIGGTYDIYYKIVNDGDYNESVSVTVTAANTTWQQIIAVHNWNIKTGEYRYPSGGDSWDTTGLSAGSYTVSVNASIPADVEWSNNERNRQVALISLKDATPPACVTDLHPTAGTTWINWTWTKPSDSDFNHTEIYLNGAFRTNTSAGYFNATGLASGTEYTIGTRTADINGNINLTWVNDTTTTLPEPDTLPPVITITSPVNDTTYNIDSVDLNYSVNESTTWQAYSLDSAANITLHENTTLTDLTDGLHTLAVYANDTSGNMNLSTVWFTIDTTPPAGITDLQHTAGQTWLNFTWTNPPYPDFNHTEIYLNGIFQTNTSAGFFNATGLASGTEYTIGTRTADINGNINLTWVNDTATTLPEPDTLPPVITITSPVNDTIYNTDSVDLNYSVNEPTTWQAYSLDSAANITLLGNTTLTHLTDGLHTLAVYANDTSGNMNSSTVWFTIDTTPPAGIADLQHTAGQTWLNWTWSNPSDPDFSHIMVYLDGIFKANISDASYNATGLNAETEHTISTCTVDSNGNMNETWVNDTATTLPVGIHDINISTDYAPERDGIKIKHDGALIDGNNLTIGGTYDIYYKIVNDGDYNESVSVTVTAANMTWQQIIAVHNWNIKTGEYRYPSGGDSWDTTGLSAGSYTVSVNASVPVDSEWSNNERNRQVALISLKDATPPACVTDLHPTAGTTWINWTWTKTSDSDFNHTEIYLNGTFQTNTSAGFFNATGLALGTEYTIGTRTADINGNINLTWVNDTATTLPEPDTLPPVITITSPVNDTTYNTDSVDLNYSVNEPTAWQGYSLNGAANITLDGNTTLTNLTDGLHTLAVYANDTAGNMNSTTVRFTIDTTPPAGITDLQHTAGQTWLNLTWTNPPDPDFNHTELYLNGTFLTNIPAPQNYYNITGLLPDTSYELSTRTVDTSGNINETWVNATARTLPLPDTTPPTITFIPPTDPGDTTLTTRNWTFINVSLSEPGFSWLEWNGINESMSGSGTHWYINKTGLDNGLYTYRVWANDSAGNVNVSETRAIEIDCGTLSPVITITSPLNDTTYNTDSVDLNYSVNEPTAWQGYSLNGAANITLDGNTTLTNLTDGLHTLAVYANDTAGNMNSSTVWFTIDTTPPAGITDLQHTAGITWLNWTWTNPPYPDFSHTMVYLDGVFKTITSNASYNATGLDAGTEHTISTRTVDSNGNMNETWVNDTATTLPLGIHDINISTDYAPETDGIKIKHDGALIDGNNLTIGDTYDIYYKIVNDGDYNESVSVTVTAANTTWQQIIAEHNWNIKTGEYRYPSGGDSWDTTGLSAGSYTVSVNASIPADVEWSNNERIRQVTLIPLKDTTPPAAISNLHPTAGLTWINWTWLNPPNPDFNHTEIYLNGTFQTNTSAGFFNATDLAPGTWYTIGTRTVDTSGNINVTWENDTASTLAEAPPVITNVGAVSSIDSAVVTWETDEDSDSLVRYGTSSGSYPFDVVSSEMVMSHALTLTGLTPDTLYYYFVSSEDGSGNLGESPEDTFRTLAVSDNEPPTIDSVLLYPVITIAGSEIEISVGASDNVGVEEVTADGNLLIYLDEGLWHGSITAASSPGSHTITIQAEDAAGNVVETTRDYTVVTPHGGVGVTILPTSPTVSSGSSADIIIQVTNTENFDDVFEVTLMHGGTYPSFLEMDLGWADWNVQSVEVSAGSSVDIPLTITVPTGESGLRLYTVEAASTHWIPIGANIGGITVI